MTNKNTIIGIVVLAVVIIGGYFLLTKEPVSAEPIKIGYIGPLTGPSAVLGMDVVLALQIAIDEINEKGGINGRMVELIVEDDQYITKNTVNAYSKLVNSDNVKIILVATYGGVFAIADQAKVDDVIIIDPLDCNSEVANINENIFCLATETESIGHSLADYLVSQNKLNTAVMYSTKDSFMALVYNAFQDRYANSGGVSIVESFNYDGTDFRTQLLKLKQSSPDALMLLGHDETGLIMKQARNLGIDVPFLTTGTITSPSAQEASGGASEGTIFAYWDSSPENTLSKDFENKFVAKVGRMPILPLTTHPAYDTIKVLLDKVFPSINGQITGEKIKDELLKVKKYQGVTGEINIDSDGGARIKESVFKLVDGMPAKI